MTDIQPDVMIVDSIQTVYLEDVTSSAGSVSQVSCLESRIVRLIDVGILPQQHDVALIVAKPTVVAGIGFVEQVYSREAWSSIRTTESFTFTTRKSSSAAIALCMAVLYVFR